ncbi:MAG: SDR family NAD(P)-dependent oxidoreductase [Hyphomicrobiaceae bacterium]
MVNENGVRWRTAWVTGASSGIGKAIALEIARRGCTVAASARSADTLNEMARDNGRILPFPVDVTDAAAVASTVGSIMDRLGGPPDLVFFSAGVGRFSSATRFDRALFEESMRVNVVALGDALAPLIPPMIARGSGHIALVASLAGYRGLPRAVTYAPSKAAVISLAECLRFDLQPKGITVTMINPGYVDTPMTRKNDFPMPFLMTLDKATGIILRGLERGKFEIRFPWQIGTMVALGRLLSNTSYYWLVKRSMQPKR